MENIIIKEGMTSMDFVKVSQMLSNAYWCLEIKIDEAIKSASIQI